MKKLAIILALTIGLLSCENKTEKHTDKPLTENQQTTKDEKLELNFNEPVLIDSSVYVMYPLSLENDNSDSYGSSSGRQRTYWNIIFYNTANGKYHLLSDSLKMVIYSYNTVNNNSETSSYFGNSEDVFENAYNQVDRLLYYSITTNDFNNDGKLNSDDPTYLYITNKAGQHLKQVSPENVNVTGWKTIKGTNKILLMGTKDTNGDKKFDDKDEWVPLVYDLTKNTISTDIFTSDYKTRLKNLFNKQWTKE